MIRVWNYVWNCARSKFFKSPPVVCGRRVAVTLTHESSASDCAHACTRFTDINVLCPFCWVRTRKNQSSNRKFTRYFSFWRIRFVSFCSNPLCFDFLYFSFFSLITRTYTNCFFKQSARVLICVRLRWIVIWICELNDLWVQCVPPNYSTGLSKLQHSLGN